MLIVPQRPGYGVSTHAEDYHAVGHAMEINSLVSNRLGCKSLVEAAGIATCISQRGS